MFRVLRKKKHSSFISFIKRFFSVLIFSIPEQTKIFKYNHNPIKGIKFLINGKIKGKARSSTTCVTLGQVPIQTLDSNIDFSKVHVFTIYGVFGLKLWVCR